MGILWHVPKAKTPSPKTKWKPGDRVRIKTREATAADQESLLYFPHLAGLTGTVRSVFSETEIAVVIDVDSMSEVMVGAHKEAVKRMRAKFLGSLGEEQKRNLSPEEKRFNANYVVLVKAADLEKGPPKPKSEPNLVEDEEVEEYEGESIAQGVLYDDPEIAETSARLSPEDLDKAEEEELRRRQGKKTKRR